MRQDEAEIISGTGRKQPLVFFSVGEPSGDLHGASLIEALRVQYPAVRCVGLGGPRMAAAGCTLLADLTELAIMWFVRAVWHFPQFLGLLRQADRYFRDHRPDCVVLIDYPGFNWWIARRAKKYHIPVIYYGTPQIWAWAGWRIRKMRRLTDHVLCKLPFEEPWFRERGCNAHWVGHPYFDHLATRPVDRAYVRRYQQSDQGRHVPLVAILPGSRTQEVVKNLPPFLRTARRVREQVSEVRFVVASFNEAQAELARQMVAAAGIEVEVQVHRTAELIEASDMCMACSGSVSLELLYHERPAVILYTISRWANAIQRQFRQVRYITLVNLLAVSDIFAVRPPTYDPDAQNAVPLPYPEYLTATDRAPAMAAHLVRWLTDATAYGEKRRELSGLRQRVVEHGGMRGRASARAAEYILSKVLQQNVYKYRESSSC